MPVRPPALCATSGDRNIAVAVGLRAERRSHADALPSAGVQPGSLEAFRLPTVVTRSAISAARGAKRRQGDLTCRARPFTPPYLPRHAAVLRVCAEESVPGSQGSGGLLFEWVAKAGFGALRFAGVSTQMCGKLGGGRDGPLRSKARSPHPVHPKDACHRRLAYRCFPWPPPLTTAPSCACVQLTQPHGALRDNVSSQRGQ